MWVPAARAAAGRRLALAPSPLLPWRAGGPTLQRWSSSSATPPQESDGPPQRTLADADGPKGAKRARQASRELAQSRPKPKNLGGGTLAPLRDRSEETATHQDSVLQSRARYEAAGVSGTVMHGLGAGVRGMGDDLCAPLLPTPPVCICAHRRRAPSRPGAVR